MYLFRSKSAYIIIGELLLTNIVPSSSRYKAHSTHANICDIEGGSLSAFSTWKSAVKHFADALAAGFVERVSVVTVRENMAEADYTGLITPWKF